jgi:hypothetical protein
MFSASEDGFVGIWDKRSEESVNMIKNPVGK